MLTAINPLQMAMGRLPVITIKRHRVITIREATVIPFGLLMSESSSGEESSMDKIQKEEAYHIGVTNTADEVDQFFRRCYNCSVEGHPWRDCKELKEALKATLKSTNDWMLWEQKA